MKTYRYLIRNFYDDNERFIVVGTKGIMDAINTFCTRYDKIFISFNEKSSILETLFDKWICMKIK